MRQIFILPDSATQNIQTGASTGLNCSEPKQQHQRQERGDFNAKETKRYAGAGKPVTICAMLVLSATLLIPNSARLFEKSADYEGLAHKVGVDIGNVESTIQRLEGEVSNPIATSRFYSLEKRLIDARVHFELKNYAQAAILYSDAIEKPGFRGHSDYWSVLFRLGYSLYKLRNYMGAKTYFTKLLVASSGRYYQRGLRYLVEMALDSRHNDGLQEAVTLAGRLTLRTPETQYSYAKGLFQLGQETAALRELGKLKRETTVYSAARYYMAVIYTDQRKLKAALSTFKDVVATPVSKTNKTHKMIRELAYLGMGRIYLEGGKSSMAIDAYQGIPRNSKHFHTAMFELTWAYVRQKQFVKALGTLQILLLTAEDDHLTMQANILQGRLNIHLDRADAAEETYDDIVERFSSVRDELETFSKKRANLGAYFKWLLNRHADTFRLEAVLSRRATKWIESDEDMREVVALFDEMSQERRDVKESTRILKSLEAALKAGNRLEIFPKLKNRWTRIAVAENQLIRLNQIALNALARLARPYMTSSERKTLDRLMVRRKRLDRLFARMPQSVAQYKTRKETVDRRFADLRRESFLAETVIKELRDQLEALEKWLRRSRYRKRGRKIGRDIAQRHLARLSQEKRRLRTIYKELVDLKEKIDNENARTGVGDVVTQNETNIKNRLIASLRDQRMLLSNIIGRMSPREREWANRFTAINTRVSSGFNRLGRLLATINRAADAKIADFSRQLARERQLLIVYRRKVKDFERDSEVIARNVGVPLFKAVQKRLSTVVLNADLGLIDVAWKRKRKESDKIAALKNSREKQLRRLEKALEQILKD